MNPPFNLLIVGQTCCGKTYYLLDLLKNNYKNVFDFIVLINPTFCWNKSYQECTFIMDKDILAIPCDQDDVDNMLGHVVEVFKGTNTLIILDDCAASQSVKGRCGNLVKLAFHARHYGLSSIVITQQLTSIAKAYRENISGLVVFYLSNKNDMKTITDDFLGDLEKKEIVEIIKILKSKKYSALEINLRFPYGYKIKSCV